MTKFDYKFEDLEEERRCEGCGAYVEEKPQDGLAPTCTECLSRIRSEFEKNKIQA